MRRATATLIFLLLMGPVPAAGAQQVGRCYPPPCAQEEPAPFVAAQLTVASDPPAAVVDDARSPAPFVATGLLGVLGSLAIVALRRRSHIVQRTDAPVRAPGSPVVGPAPSSGPQPAHR